VINAKLNTPPAQLPPTRPLISDQAAIGHAASTIQIRAYELYEGRGKIDGFAEHDWYQAENHLRASSKQSVADSNARTFSKALHVTGTV
jgi:hypothetical protein